ncbi:MAG: YceI family protein [Acidimicrobiales bacterium]
MSETTAVPGTPGAQAPDPGTYGIDASHSSVGFTARHLMVSKVRGRFGTFSGTIVVADPPEQSSVEVTVDTASIDTGDAKRDEHLRSADFLNVEEYPSMTFKSTSVKVTGSDRLELVGDLTVLGQTRPVTLQASYEGVATDPWGGTRLGFDATGEVDREDWGLTWNVALETGGFLVGKKIQLDVGVEAVKQ